MRRFITGLLILGALLLTRPVVAAQPNIVLIMADDLTWTDMGCYGHPDVKTPNIDRLAKGGMRFKRSFTATAMCAPTRQQLYTGLFPIRNGAYPNHSKVKPGTKSIVHHLKALGYRVGLSGKKHFGPPASFPFQNVPAAKRKAFINRNAEQPYCLVVTSHSPHLPWKAGDASTYAPEKLTLPPYLVDTPETRKALTHYYAEVTDFDREVGECMALVENSKQAENTIFICTSEQGAQFPHGKWTCYDIGLHTALIIQWPKMVKPGSTTDAMVQYVDMVPTLVEAAGGKPIPGLDGKSFLKVLQGKTDKHHEHVYGVHTTRGIIQGTLVYPIRSIRTNRYKYIWNPNARDKFQNVLTAGIDKGGYWKSWVEKARTDTRAAELVHNYQKRPEEELYDLVNDPYELHNIAEKAENKDLKSRLSRKLKQWMQQQGDKGIATEKKAKLHRTQREK